MDDPIDSLSSTATVLAGIDGLLSTGRRLQKVGHRLRLLCGSEALFVAGTTVSAECADAMLELLFEWDAVNGAVKASGSE